MAAGALAGRSALAAAPTGNDLVHATLLADVDSVKPGKPFTLGVLLKITPGWHIYWKNPGDSGLPTRVKWNLREGFSAGELKFPIPTHFELPGDIAGYGYHDEVLLTATITPPNSLETGKKLTLGADVAWLVCEKVCLPGKATAMIELPVGAEAKPANKDVFEKWTARLPIKIGGVSPQDSPQEMQRVVDLGLSEFGGLNREGLGKPLAAYVTWLKAPKKVEWFPVPPKESSVENASTKTDTTRSTFTFDLTPFPKEANSMDMLVVYTDQNGKERGAEFTVLLPPTH